MFWNNLVKHIKAIFIQPEKKEWLDKLVKNIERQRDENKNIPFKITDIKNRGFVVKVSGLYAYISYNHMPWKYNDIDSWKAIYPKLIDKIFYGKIYQIKKAPLSIIINGEIPQFKKSELTIGEEYTGLIIKKSNYGVFVDIGYHFDWRCGSLVGLLHKSQFGTNQSISNCVTGEEILTTYHGLNENGKLIYSNDTEKIDWYFGKPQGLVGQIVWVQVVRKPNEKGIELLAKGKYKGKMTISKQDYPPKHIKKIKQAKNELTDGKIINCEVTGFSDKKRILELKWIAELDTEIVTDNSIMNNLDNDTLQKLTSLRNEIEA